MAAHQPAEELLLQASNAKYHQLNNMTEPRGGDISISGDLARSIPAAQPSLGLCITPRIPRPEPELVIQYQAPTTKVGSRVAPSVRCRVCEVWSAKTQSPTMVLDGLNGPHMRLGGSDMPASRRRYYWCHHSVILLLHRL